MATHNIRFYFFHQGDFVFYSVLVSKAALYSFTAAVACILVILTGLAGTLGLLAIQGKALPGRFWTKKW